MRLGSTVVRSLREGALWVFGALAFIVLAALLSYYRNDPSFATTGEPGPISNVIGPFGAHLSGLLVLLFGAPSFLFPIMIGANAGNPVAVTSICWPASTTPAGEYVTVIAL